MSLPDHVEALVVGGGAAGLSAATWLGRYQRATLVIDAAEHRNRSTDHVHGYLTRDPISPQEFIAEAHADLTQYPTVTLQDGRVAAIRPADGDGGFVATVDDSEVTARRIVLATGVRDVFPNVDGFDEHYGLDVYHCPSCDGYEARNRTVVVLGSGAHVPAYAADLLDWAARVRIVTDTTEPAFSNDQRDECAQHGIDIVDSKAEAFVGDPGALRGIRVADGRLVAGDMAFFSYDHHPTNDLARQLGCDIDDDGRVTVDAYHLTSVDGVYAAGDIPPGMQLAAIAVGQGAIAGVACATSLHGHPTGPTSPPPARRFTDR